MTIRAMRGWPSGPSAARQVQRLCYRSPNETATSAIDADETIDVRAVRGATATAAIGDPMVEVLKAADLTIAARADQVLVDRAAAVPLALDQVRRADTDLAVQAAARVDKALTIDKVRHQVRTRGMGPAALAILALRLQWGPVGLVILVLARADRATVGPMSADPVRIRMMAYRIRSRYTSICTTTSAVRRPRRCGHSWAAGRVAKCEVLRRHAQRPVATASETTMTMRMTTTARSIPMRPRAKIRRLTGLSPSGNRCAMR
jgi:hypothetical protein